MLIHLRLLEGLDAVLNVQVSKHGKVARLSPLVLRDLLQEAQLEVRLVVVRTSIAVVTRSRGHVARHELKLDLGQKVDDLIITHQESVRTVDLIHGRELRILLTLAISILSEEL